MPRNLHVPQQRSEAAKRKNEQARSAQKNWNANEKWRHPQYWNWTAISSSIVAIATVVIALVGYLQWKTLGGQLSEMKQGTLDTHTALVDVQRPLIVANDLKITPASEDGKKPVYWLISQVIENAGNTTTRDLEVFTGIYVDDLTLYKNIPNLVPSNPDITELELATSHFANKWTLAPKDTITVPPYIIEETQAQEMRDGTLSIYILGVAYYYDTIGGIERHKTKFCFRLFGWSGDPDNGGKWGTKRVDLAQIPVVSSRPCFHNNCTDTDCGEEQPIPSIGK